MSVTMRPLGCSFSVCGSWGAGTGEGLGQGGMREDNTVHVPMKVPPPSHLGELFFSLQMGGLEHGALRFFTFSTTQEYILYKIDIIQKDSNTEFPIYLPTHAKPVPFLR